MPQITRALLRKRAEHNECILGNLEELALHQEELESINGVLGASCKKLKILLLQNNIISKIENLHHMKDLEYLNLGLNNISIIEGLSSNEFLTKLDLTLNFIDINRLKQSVDQLSSLVHLKDLFLMGNPCQKWTDCNSYVTARLPQLEQLDGKEILLSDRIMSVERLSIMEAELERLSLSIAQCLPSIDDYKSEDPDLTQHCPESRTKMYQEVAMEKKEKEDLRNVNCPKQRDYASEHQASVTALHASEDGMKEEDVRQRNEGKYDFIFDEEATPGCLTLDVGVPRLMDTSLMNVDVHPTYVSIVIKGKLLRLRLPVEVRSQEAKAQRSAATGRLLIIMPKVDQTSLPTVTGRRSDEVKKVTESNSRVVHKTRTKTKSTLDELIDECAQSKST